MLELKYTLLHQIETTGFIGIAEWRPTPYSHHWHNGLSVRFSSVNRATCVSVKCCLYWASWIIRPCYGSIRKLFKVPSSERSRAPARCCLRQQGHQYILAIAGRANIVQTLKSRSRRLTVRTLGSHPRNPGSIPGEITIWKITVCQKYKQRIHPCKKGCFWFSTFYFLVGWWLIEYRPERLNSLDFAVRKSS